MYYDHLQDNLAHLSHVPMMFDMVINHRLDKIITVVMSRLVA